MCDPSVERVSSLHIRFAQESYPFYVGSDCVEELVSKLEVLDADRLVVVTDQFVAQQHGTRVMRALSRIAPTSVLQITPGEQNKQLHQFAEITERALESGMTRRSVVVAFGGGLVGNLGGLLAGLAFRGVRLVHIPTTIIAMFDSVLSLKQAINARRGKNLIGLFHKPEMVLADVGFLKSLPAVEIRSGLCEVVKNALAIDPTFIPFLEEVLNPDARYDECVLREMLSFSIRAKNAVMCMDPHEQREGLVLEYGHTIGHAIELSLSSLPTAIARHGECVAVGMMAAASIANELGLLPSTVVRKHVDLLARAGLDVAVPYGLDPETVVQVVAFDNKRGYRTTPAGGIDMILLCDLGKVSGDRRRPLTSVPLTHIRRVLSELTSSQL